MSLILSWQVIMIQIGLEILMTKKQPQDMYLALDSGLFQGVTRNIQFFLCHQLNLSTKPYAV